MTNIYENLRDDDGNLINGRTKLFVKCTDDDGIIDEYMTGLACVPESCGRMFIVDDWLLEQIDKLLMINHELVVKDGEELVPPVKSDLDLEEEELQRQLADIQRRRAEKANEPPAEVEELPPELPEHDEK